jgi:flagellar protein FlbD
MIELSLINDTHIVLNSDLIEFMEATPDTVISLTTGKKVMVKESVAEVIGKVVNFRKRVGAPVQEPCLVLDERDE